MQRPSESKQELATLQSSLERLSVAAQHWCHAYITRQKIDTTEAVTPEAISMPPPDGSERPLPPVSTSRLPAQQDTSTVNRPDLVRHDLGTNDTGHSTVINAAQKTISWRGIFDRMKALWGDITSRRIF